MTYILPVLYVIVSYTFFLLAVHFGNAITLQIVSILLPFIMGIVNLIVVLTVGRKWSRKTLLNCTLIIKYGLIPFYLIGGSITVYVTLMAFFPLPLMALFGLVTIVFLIFGYGILLGAAPYAIAYLIKSCKDGIHPKWLAVLAGICQFFFSFDVLAMMVLTLKERHRVKTTIAVFCAMCLALLLIVLYVVMTLIGHNRLYIGYELFIHKTNLIESQKGFTLMKKQMDCFTDRMCAGMQYAGRMRLKTSDISSGSCGQR